MKNDKFQENLSRPGIIDAKARYRRLRNTNLLEPPAMIISPRGFNERHCDSFKIYRLRST